MTMKKKPYFYTLLPWPFVNITCNLGIVLNKLQHFGLRFDPVYSPVNIKNINHEPCEYPSLFLGIFMSLIKKSTILPWPQGNKLLLTYISVAMV